MLCPVDATELKRIDRQGVEIDLCPSCRGVWLDRGELDKIIEGAYAMPASAAQDTAPTNQQASPPGVDPPAVGVWADEIQQPPAQPTPPPRVQTAQPAQDYPLPGTTVGDLIAGLASASLAGQGQRKPGKRKKNRGWLEEMFDIDLD